MQAPPSNFLLYGCTTVHSQSQHRRGCVSPKRRLPSRSWSNSSQLSISLARREAGILPGDKKPVPPSAQIQRKKQGRERPKVHLCLILFGRSVLLFSRASRSPLAKNFLHSLLREMEGRIKGTLPKPREDLDEEGSERKRGNNYKQGAHLVCSLLG